MENQFVNKYGYRLFAVGFWLLFWEIVSRVVGEDILLPPPVAVIQTVIQLSIRLEFWQTILNSSVRIVLGFLLALIIGILFAVMSFSNKLLSELISPLMKVIKAAPVASFIILALIWINPRSLSILISFLMVVPLIYMNVLQGLHNTDNKLLEMAKVFDVGRFRKIITIYIPSVLPYFLSAISVGLGFCWKAGIAAEVIGIPRGSIGLRLYEAKLYWMTKEVFAWSIVIIIISILFEKIVMLLFQIIQKTRNS